MVPVEPLSSASPAILGCSQRLRPSAPRCGESQPPSPSPSPFPPAPRRGSGVERRGGAWRGARGRRGAQCRAAARRGCPTVCASSAAAATATVAAALLGLCCARGGAAPAARPRPPRPRNRPRCCCCVGLRRGALAVGAGQLVQGSLLCAFYLCLWLLGRDYDDPPLHALCIIKALHNLADVVFDAVLILGVVTGRRAALSAWLWATAAGLLLTALPGVAAPLAAVAAALAHAPPPHLDDAHARGFRRTAAVAAAAALLLGAAQTALSVHFLLVVRRLRDRLRAKDAVAPGPPPLPPPGAEAPRRAWEAEELPPKAPPSKDDFVLPADADQDDEDAAPDTPPPPPPESPKQPHSHVLRVGAEVSVDGEPAGGRRPPTPGPKRGVRRAPPGPPPGNPPSPRHAPHPK